MTAQHTPRLVQALQAQAHAKLGVFITVHVADGERLFALMRSCEARTLAANLVACADAYDRAEALALEGA